jgi:hypothetical protein
MLYRETLDCHQEAGSVTYTETSFGHKTFQKFTECELAGFYILLLEM